MENLSPQILRGVLKEVTELVKGPPEGIKVHMNDEDITDIQATIAGPGECPFAVDITSTSILDTCFLSDVCNEW